MQTRPAGAEPEAAPLLAVLYPPPPPERANG